MGIDESRRCRVFRYTVALWTGGDARIKIDGLVDLETCGRFLYLACFIEVIMQGMQYGVLRDCSFEALFRAEL